MNIGFTGTQRSLANDQRERLRVLLEDLRRTGLFKIEFHHGDCIGADETAANMAWDLGYWIVCHPPLDRRKRAFTKFNHIHLPRPYFIRNHDIVDATKILVACPGENTEVLRSGTWATVRYARKLKREVIMVLP